MEQLNTPLQPYSVFLRSSEFTSTSNTDKSDLFFDLNTPIRCLSNMSMLMKLQSFKYTNSFYTINDNNNMFYYKFSGQAVNGVTLILGNYNVDEFLSYLAFVFNTLFTFKYNENTLKITITSISLTPFILSAGPYNCFEVLGFDTETDTALSATQNAPYLMNMMGVEVLHITVGNININSVGVKNQRKYNIIDSVHVNAPKGETETYTNVSNFMYKLSDNVITFLNITIYDQDFNVIDFNNIDWYINIIFAFQYIPDLILPPTINDINQQIENTMRQDIIQEERRNVEEYLQSVN